MSSTAKSKEQLLLQLQAYQVHYMSVTKEMDLLAFQGYKGEGNENDDE